MYTGLSYAGEWNAKFKILYLSLPIYHEHMEGFAPMYTN